MKSILFVSAIALSATVAMPAFASDEDKRDTCQEVAKENWMTEDAIKAKATEMGYDVRNLKTEDGCYEIYAIDKDGKKVEAYLHPGTGEVVHSKMED